MPFLSVNAFAWTSEHLLVFIQYNPVTENEINWNQMCILKKNVAHYRDPLFKSHWGLWPSSPLIMGNNLLQECHQCGKVSKKSLTSKWLVEFYRFCHKMNCFKNVLHSFTFGTLGSVMPTACLKCQNLPESWFTLQGTECPSWSTCSCMYVLKIAYWML